MMSSSAKIEKELKLIRQRLMAIEDVLAEEMSGDEKRALKEALREHREGKSVLFSKVRNS
jgi:hypothetical protein